MRLLEKNLESFELLTAARTNDNQGGRHAAWSVSGTLDACAVVAQSPHAHARDQTEQRANADHAEPVYTVLTKRSVMLPFHAIIRRVKDGRCFRIISDGTDAETPKGALLDLRMFAAEQWRLAGEIILPEPEEGEADDQS